MSAGSPMLAWSGRWEGLGPTVATPATLKVTPVTAHTTSSDWTCFHGCAEMSCLYVAHLRDHKFTICCWQFTTFMFCIRLHSLYSVITVSKLLKSIIHDKSPQSRCLTLSNFASWNLLKTQNQRVNRAVNVEDVNYCQNDPVQLLLEPAQQVPNIGILDSALAY